jgi:hypothetical protein
MRGYYEARERSRAARRQGNTLEDHQWSYVAREILSCRRLITGLNGWDRVRQVGAFEAPSLIVDLS